MTDFLIDDGKNKVEGLNKEQINSALNLKADSNYVNVKLAKKADKTNTYTKSEVDSALLEKANADNVYTKEQSNEKFATKSDLDHIPTELGFIKTLQRFDKTKILDNTGINGTTGNFNVDNNYWVSNFIGIDVGASKVITNEAANGLYFYSDNSYLGRVTSVPANTAIDIPYPAATRLCLRYSKSYTPIIKAKDIILSFGEVLSTTKEMYILQDIVSVKEDIVEINDKLNLIDRNYETRQVIATETMSTGDFIYLDVPDIKKNNQIGFHAIVSTLGKIVLSHGQSQSYSAAKIEVDNTNIYVYGYLANAWTLYNTIAHGLTISNNIDIAVDVNNNLTANISVSSNGSVFVKEGVIWNGNSQFVQADIESGEYKNCILTFDCPDYNKALWVFGDSYLDMWPQILAVNGIDDYYLDGFSGRNSVAALASFEKAIQFGRPKKLAWFLGMNDRDGKIVNGVSDATGVNANWLTAFTAVKNWCDNNNVELIACTIPEVPARDHTYKNAYIKSLGIRYVDVAGVVGATTLGSHWYNYGQANAYLANDEVHPSKPYGRNTIAYKMLVDMPEMISDIKMSTYTNGEIDALLLHKADKTTTYTKEQVDDIVYNILPDDTASGSVANFTTSLELPIKYEVENTANVVTRCGVNLWDEDWEVGAIDNATGQDIDNPNAYRTKGYIKVPLGENLYMCNDNAYTIGCRFYDADKNFLSSRAFLTSKVMVRGTNDLPTNAAFIRFVNVSSNIYSNDIGINYPQTETTYAHYNGDEYPISNPSNLPIIMALDGVNNLFADSGDVSVVFKQSVNDAINAAVNAVNNSRSLNAVNIAKSGETEEEKPEEVEEPKEETKK